MGNSAAKEQRAGHSHRLGTSPGQSPSSSSGQLPTDQAAQEIYVSRHGRGSRSELSSLLGLGSNNDRDPMTLEQRRESKQEREAKRLERERIAREKERTRSMRDEHVDGGFLVTQGVYTGVEDYSKIVVRRLMIERRIAPFWRGLNDHSDAWTENQLVAAARGLHIPAADEIPKQESPEPPPRNVSNTALSEKNVTHLTVPIGSRSQSFNSDASGNPSPISPTFHIPIPSTSGPSVLRGRSKTLASLTASSRGPPQQELQPREVMLPSDPKINGQPIEAYLYKDAAECPICFLYYPPYLNRTRCCDQAICSECFVQIKRPDPHQPEHADPTAPPPPPPENPEVDVEGLLVSEPASCPFCKQPEFGVTFEAPPFRRGLVYSTPASHHPLQPDRNISSPMSSSSSLQSTGTGGLQVVASGERRRAASLSASAPTVITTDRVRPDWATKLNSARAHAERRSAAATALHTAAYLMGGRNNDSPDSRTFAGFGRRGVLRRGTGDSGPGSISAAQQLNMLALMSERYATAGGRAGGSNMGEASSAMAGTPRESSRRNRMDNLEDMMMMEAIRLSLAAEEERTRREEKEAKKEAKKKAKEEKKEEKKARKSGALSPGFNRSATNLALPFSSGSSTSHPNDTSKGKAIERPRRDLPLDQSGRSQSLSRSVPTESSVPPNPQAHLERSREQLHPMTNTDLPPPPVSPYGASTFRPSHLRNLSNVSSSSSSLAEAMHENSRSSQEVSPNTSGINISRSDSVTPAGGGAGLEPMFNFQSLAAMIGHEDQEGGEMSEKGDDNKALHIENVSGVRGVGEGAVNAKGHQTGSSLGESVGTLKQEEYHDAMEDREAVESISPNFRSGSKGTDAETTEIEHVGNHTSTR